MKTSKLILLDTNVLVYNHQGESEFHAQSERVLRKGFRGQLALCVCPQVLVEFYAIITNPRRVTNPAPADEAIAVIEKILLSKSIEKIYPKEDTIIKTVALLKKYKVKQMEIFDLQLVATMLSNDVTRIYTFNQSDFQGFSEIKVLAP